MTNLASIFLAVFSVSAAFVSGTKAQQPVSQGLPEIRAAFQTFQRLMKSVPALTKKVNGRKILKVVRAKVQFVPTKEYAFTILIPGSIYHNDECDVVIKVTPSGSTNKLTRFKCQWLKPDYRILKESQITDNIQKMAQIGVIYINLLCRCQIHRVVIDVLRAKTYYAGTMFYRIDFIIGESICPNSSENREKGIDKCPLKKNGRVQQCMVELESAPWVPYQAFLTEQTCLLSLQLKLEINK